MPDDLDSAGRVRLVGKTSALTLGTTGQAKPIQIIPIRRMIKLT